MQLLGGRAAENCSSPQWEKPDISGSHSSRDSLKLSFMCTQNGEERRKISLHNLFIFFKLFYDFSARSTILTVFSFPSRTIHPLSRAPAHPLLDATLGTSLDWLQVLFSAFLALICEWNHSLDHQTSSRSQLRAMAGLLVKPL